MRRRLSLIISPVALLACLIACAARTPRTPLVSPMPMTDAWSVRLADPGAGGDDLGLPESMVTDGEAIYLLTAPRGIVRALDPATGAVRWENMLAPGALSVANGMVYLRRAEGGVAALDAKTGAVRWQSSVGSPGETPAAVSGDRLAVVGRGVALLDARTGEKVWTSRGLGLFSTPPLIAGGRLVAGTQDGAIQCLELATGKPLWSYKTGTTLQAAPVTDDHGRVFMGTGDGRLLALSLNSGKRRWQWDVGAATAFPAVCYKDVVIFLPFNATVTALRRHSGDVAWRTVLASRPVAPPILQGDILFTFCYGARENRTTVAAFDALTGRPLGNADAMGETRAAPLLLSDHLVFAYRDRSIAGLALSKTAGAEKGLASRRKMRDLGLEATPTPTPRRKR